MAINKKSNSQTFEQKGQRDELIIKAKEWDKNDELIVHVIAAAASVPTSSQ